MNRRELQYLEKLLERVKDPDGKVAKALARPEGSGGLRGA